jgi:hypothetical protein
VSVEICRLHCTGIHWNAGPCTVDVLIRGSNYESLGLHKGAHHGAVG